MKFHPLRVSQLIYLSAYAALIGSALGYGYPEKPKPIVTYLSQIPGCVWVEASDANESMVVVAEGSIESQGMCVRLVEIKSQNPKKFPQNWNWTGYPSSDPWSDLGEVRDLPDGEYVLVESSALRSE